MNRNVVGAVSLVALLVAGCGKDGNAGDDAAAEAATSQEVEPALTAAPTTPAVTTPASTTPAVTTPASTPPKRRTITGADGTEVLLAEPIPNTRELLAATRPGQTPTPAGRTALPQTLQVSPVSLDLGTVAANKSAVGTVTLTNTGDEPITIAQCKSSCGCTSLNCPKGEQIAAGDSRAVDVKITAGARARPINKTVTFLVEGQEPVTLPVSARVISYVAVEPTKLDPTRAANGTLTIRSTDGEPFRIVSMDPAILDSFDSEPKVRHQVSIPWEEWRNQGSKRSIYFNVDHPEMEKVWVQVQAPAAFTRNSPRQQALADAEPPLPPERKPTLPQPSDGLPPALTVAVKNGDVQPIREALTKGMAKDVQESLLTRAALYGQTDVLALLLESGATVEAKDKRGRTALMSAVHSRNRDTVDLLLAMGAEIDARDNSQGTALTRAAGPFGDEAMVNTLLAAGADVNVVDRYGQTPLIWAARYGDPQRVKALLKAGANPASRDRQGLSALDYARNRKDAASEQTVTIIQPLVDQGAKAGEKTEPGVE